MAPLSLQPEDEETDWMILGVIQYNGIPHYQVCPKHNHIHRRAVRKENILEYVSQKAYEDFEYEEAKKKEDEQWKKENELLARAQKLQQKRAENARLIERAAADKAHAKKMHQLSIQERHKRRETWDSDGETSRQESEHGDLHGIGFFDTVDNAKRKRPADEAENLRSESKRQAVIGTSQRISGRKDSLSEPSLSQRHIVSLTLDSTTTTDNEVGENEVGENENESGEEDDIMFDMEEDRMPGDHDEVPLETKKSLKRTHSARRSEPTLKVARVSSKAVSYDIPRVETPILPPLRPLAARFPWITPKSAPPTRTGVASKSTPIPAPNRIFSSIETTPMKKSYNLTQNSHSGPITGSLTRMPSTNVPLPVTFSLQTDAKYTKHPSGAQKNYAALELEGQRTIAFSSTDNDYSATSQGKIPSEKRATSSSPLGDKSVPPDLKRLSHKEIQNQYTSPMGKFSKASGKKSRRRRYRAIPDNEDDDEVVEETVWEIKGILDDEIRYADGEAIRFFLVDWEGEWHPSWEPESNVSKDALAVYRRGLGGLGLDGSHDLSLGVEKSLTSSKQQSDSLDITSIGAVGERVVSLAAEDPMAEIIYKAPISQSLILGEQTRVLIQPVAHSPLSIKGTGIESIPRILATHTSPSPPHEELVEEQEPTSSDRGRFSVGGIFSILTNYVRPKPKT